MYRRITSVVLILTPAATLAACADNGAATD